MKRSKLSRKSLNGQNELPEPQRPPQQWSDDDEKSKMLERRQNQARGEEICPECGLNNLESWHLPPMRRLPV